MLEMLKSPKRIRRLGMRLMSRIGAFEAVVGTATMEPLPIIVHGLGFIPNVDTSGEDWSRQASGTTGWLALPSGCVPVPVKRFRLL